MGQLLNIVTSLNKHVSGEEVAFAPPRPEDFGE